jgi:UDP-glucose 4-epimerase
MVDNLMTQRYCSLFNLPKNFVYKFIEADITNFEINKLINEEDIVIHLAAITDAANSFENAQKVELNNLTATSAVAKACLEKGARLITLSSTSVYGTQEKEVNEDCPLEGLKPQSPYASTKLMEEALISELYKSNNLKSVIFRFGTISGVSPGMRFHTAINKFCWQASMGLPITVWETALNQNRPYLDLNDAVNSLFFAINNNIFDGQIYNVVTKNSSVNDLLNVIKLRIPKIDINLVKHEIMNQLSYNVDCTKIKKKGFKFEGDINNSILETLELLGY